MLLALQKVKSHDFDGNELFKPTSAQKPRVAKGNMQVDEYLFRDAKVCFGAILMPSVPFNVICYTLLFSEYILGSC